jgi:phosphoglycerol geranylgeranyltransferase
LNPTWSRLTLAAQERGAGLWLLIDPEKTEPELAAATVTEATSRGCDAVLLGASTGQAFQFAEVARAVHRNCSCPVLIFPNGASQVVPHADAILFMSLLSGRNPRYLIEEQVLGAPLVMEYGLEAISTAYLLIESGKISAVQYISDTRPIPRHLPELAAAHALAARYLGMSLVYLEAGSGAPSTVPEHTVAACRATGMHVAVGGGIRNPETAATLVRAGANFIVVGNHFEKQPDWALFSELASATHPREALHVQS